MLLLSSHEQRLLSPATIPAQSQVPHLVDNLYQTIQALQHTKARSEVNHAIDLVYHIRCAGFHSLWIKHRQVLWCLRTEIWDAVQQHRQEVQSVTHEGHSNHDHSNHECS